MQKKHCRVSMLLPGPNKELQLLEPGNRMQFWYIATQQSDKQQISTEGNKHSIKHRKIAPSGNTNIKQHKIHSSDLHEILVLGKNLKYHKASFGGWGGVSLGNFSVHAKSSMAVTVIAEFFI